jgi:hypothetical protein
MAKTAILMVLLVGATFAAKQPRIWQMGTLEGSGEKRELAGSGPGPYIGAAPANSTVLAYSTWLGLVIHTDSMEYVVQYLIRRSLFSKPLRPILTIHGAVKFAVEKGALFLVDEDGKEFQTVILEKRLPRPPPAPAPAK